MGNDQLNRVADGRFVRGGRMSINVNSGVGNGEAAGSSGLVKLGEVAA